MRTTEHRLNQPESERLAPRWDGALTDRQIAAGLSDTAASPAAGTPAPFHRTQPETGK